MDSPMKIALTLWCLSLAGMAVDVVSREYGTLEPYANLGALACVVSLLIFLVCKYLPKLDKDRAKEREEHVAAMDRMADRFERREVKRDEQLELVTKRITDMAIQCAKHQSHDEE